MQEGGGAAAPVKIDPPHSFPTFSPREVCYHERGWGEEEEEDVEAGETGVTAQGVSRGLPTIVSVSVYPHLWIFASVSCAYMCVHLCMCVRTRARARARAFALRWRGEGDKRMWVHVDRYAVRSCEGMIERIFRGYS